MATRTCITCGLTDGKNFFSGRQWRKGVGRSRCLQCVLDPSRAVFDPGSLLVTDRGARARVSKAAIANPFGEGTFRLVARGTYSSGPRKGQSCVMKWIKPFFNHNQLSYSADIYHEDMRCVRRTLDFVRAFTATRTSNLAIRVHVPTLHRFSARSALPNVVYLREPYIPKYQKWNSNSGWVNQKSRTSAVMQALSHYSYHASGGNQLLCDLQGGWSNNELILTDPVIMTVGKKKFCLPDGGLSAICKFFQKHVCTEYCDPRWIRPQYFGPSSAPSNGTRNRSEGGHAHGYLDTASSRNLVHHASKVTVQSAERNTVIEKTTVRKQKHLPPHMRAQGQLSTSSVTNPTSNKALHSKSRSPRNVSMKNSQSKRLGWNRTNLEHVTVQKNTSVFFPSYSCGCAAATEGRQVPNGDTSVDSVASSSLTKKRVPHRQTRRTAATFKKETVFGPNWTALRDSNTAESSSSRTCVEWTNIDSIMPLQNKSMLYTKCSCGAVPSFTQIAGDWINYLPAPTNMTATAYDRRAATAGSSSRRPQKKKQSFVKRAIAFARKMNDRFDRLLLD